MVDKASEPNRQQRRSVQLRLVAVQLRVRLSARSASRSLCINLLGLQHALRSYRKLFGEAVGIMKRRVGGGGKMSEETQQHLSVQLCLVALQLRVRLSARSASRNLCVNLLGLQHALCSCRKSQRSLPRPLEL